MRLVSSALASLLLASSVFAAPTPPAPAASAPKLGTFSEFRKYDDMTIRIDMNSMKVYPPTDGSKATPVMGLDIELTPSELVPYEYKGRRGQLKSYVNTIFADCARDRLLVLVSRGFDTKGVMVFSETVSQFMPNEHVRETPVSEVMDHLVCPALYKRFPKTP